MSSADSSTHDPARAHSSRPDIIRVRARISGDVQGVGFRAHTQREAELRTVTGWVRNKPDGTVESELEGTRESVDALLEWLRRGPSAASVNRVSTESIDSQSDTDFAVH